MNNKIVLGNKIAFYRKKLKMTQSEFIEKVNQIAGITFRNATLSSWENGQSSPTGDLLPVIAKILRTPVNNLFIEQEVIEITPEVPAKVEEPEENYTTSANAELYRRIFEESPQEAFDELLKQYQEVLKANEKLRSENQKLEGKLTASAEILKQIIESKKR